MGLNTPEIKTTSSVALHYWSKVDSLQWYCFVLYCVDTPEILHIFHMYEDWWHGYSKTHDLWWPRPTCHCSYINTMHTWLLQIPDFHIVYVCVSLPCQNRAGPHTPLRDCFCLSYTGRCKTWHYINKMELKFYFTMQNLTLLEVMSDLPESKDQRKVWCWIFLSDFQS